MPIGSVSYRDICNRHENKKSKYLPDSQVQKQANDISASQALKTPQTCCFTSAMYGSAVILNCMSCVINSTLSTPRGSPQKNEQPEPAKAITPNPGGFASTVSQISALDRQKDPLPRLSALASHHRTGMPFATAAAMNSPEHPSNSHPPFQAPIIASCCGLPMALAQSPENSMEGIVWHENEQEWVAESDSGKRKLLDVAQLLLENSGYLRQSEINEQRLQWEVQAAGTPVILTAAPLISFYARDKRISFKDRDKMIARHIEENCVSQEQFTDPKGKSQGSTLLFVANILDMSTSHLLEKDAPQWKTISSKIADLGIFSITLGMSSAIGSPLAAFLRKIYFRLNNDPICEARFGRIAIASLGTGLSIGGTGGPIHVIPSPRRPLELQNVLAYTPRTSYIAKNQASNIQTNLLLTAQRRSTSGKQEKTLLIPQSSNEFDALPFEPTSSVVSTRKVRYDASSGKWHELDITGGPLLDVAFTEGDKFIELYGQKYPLKITGENLFEISVSKPQGLTEYLPVYREPISKTWHLKTVNGEPIFTTADRVIIEKLKISKSDNFQYRPVKTREAQDNKAGPRYEMRNKQDDPEKTTALSEVIEINGAILSVRKTAIKNQQDGFTVIDPKAPGKPGRLVEWDGERWRFQKPTSHYVSAELNRSITSDMFAKNVDESQLSAPDGQGIRWSGKHGYLDVRGEYVELLQGPITKIGTREGKNIPVYYNHQQFHPIKVNAKNALKRREISEHFFDSLKDQTPGQLTGGIKFADIEKAIRSALSSSSISLPIAPMAVSATKLGSTISSSVNNMRAEVKVEVTAITSSQLDQKRYLITLSEGADDYFILDISRDGKKVKVLSDADSEIAMEKHQRSLVGIDIPTVIALKRNCEEPLFRADSRAQIDDIVIQRIKTGASLFRNTLEKMKTKGVTGRSMIVGHADFLSTASFENNVFSSPETVYMALIDYFKPLSREYPDTIIIPGSIYMSRDIPKGMLHKKLIYQQGEISREVGDAINFSTVIVPVLFNGKFVTIARKGECLTYRREDAPPYEDESWLLDLDAPIPRAATLKINNVKFNPFSTPSEWQDAQTGTIFAGKTLLPGEKLHADWFFCPCLDGTGSAIDIDYFFKSEFIIDDNKFLIVIEDEFMQQADTRPIVRRLAYPQNETIEESNRYDWIIHPAIVSEVDDKFRAAAINYLYVPSHSNSLFNSDLNERARTRTQLNDEKLAIVEFSSMLNASATLP